MFITEVVLSVGGIQRGILLAGIPNILAPLMYVNGVDTILGTPFNIVHPGTPPPHHYNLNDKVELSPFSLIKI